MGRTAEHNNAAAEDRERTCTMKTTKAFSRNQAVELLTELGVMSAPKWSIKRLEAKLPNIEDLVDEGTKLKGAPKATLAALRAAIKENLAIEVVDPTTKNQDDIDAEMTEAPAKPAKKGAKKAPAPEPEPTEDAEPTEDEPQAEDQTDDTETAEGGIETPPPAPPAKPAKKTPPPTETKTQKEPARKLEALGGVRQTRSRSFLAGAILKKHGLVTEITQTMVDELNTAYGRANDAESFYTLRDAWHVVRGFVDGDKAINNG